MKEIIQRVSRKDKTYFLVLLLGIFLLFNAPADPDFGWHYKYGEYLVQNRQILRENIYSYTFPDYNWANSYPIAQVIFYTAYSTLGPVFAGLILAFITSFTVTFLLEKGIKYNNLKHPKIVLTISSLIIFMLFNGFSVVQRPMLFSSVFILFLTLALLYNKKLIKWAPLLFLIWANAHADFTLGLAVLGIYNLNLLIRQGIEKENFTIHMASILSVFITFLNPYGIELWKTILNETNSIQFSYIAEWLPLTGKSLIPFYYMASALIITSLIEIRDKKKRGWLILCAFAFFLGSVRSSYFARIFIVLGIFPLMEFLEKTLLPLGEFFGEKDKGKMAKASEGVLVFLLLTSGLLFAQRIYKTSEHSVWAKSAGMPYEAVKFIRENPQLFKGNLFNDYSWGGYLIWKLPEHKTFIDGRMPSWSETALEKNEYSLLEEYRSIVSNPEENYGLLEKYRVGWVLLKPEGKLTEFLIHDNEWQLIQEFENSTVLKKLE